MTLFAPNTLPRRTFLRGLSAMSLAAAPAAFAREPVPLVKAVPLEDYVAFLAHEHRAALVEMRATENPLHVPMAWFPDSPQIVARIAAEAPSMRAGRLFAALNLPTGGVP